MNSSMIKTVFSEREDFILIGLTGRTGSGCSTVAKLLTHPLDVSSLEEPKTHILTNEDRKYKIVYNFIPTKWHPFTCIQVTSIILSFAMQYDEHLLTWLDEKYGLKDESGLQEKYNQCKELYKNYRLDKPCVDNLQEPQLFSAYSFYFEELPQLNKLLKSALGEKYTNAFQDFGTNIRSSGTVNSNVNNGEHLLDIANRINLLIKLARKYNKIRNKSEANRYKDYFVIDAIRNSYEAFFFKQRFSAFYLFAINTSERERTDRLYKLNLSADDIENIDLREAPSEERRKKAERRQGKSIPKETKYSDINIQNCIQVADVHIYNPDSIIPNKYIRLYSTLIRYLSLILHPAIVTPTKEERCMQIAYTAKFNSGCISRQVGAVITDEDYSIKSVGWNDTPYGQVPCLLRSVAQLIDKRDQEAYSNYELTDNDFNTEFKNMYEKNRTSEKLAGRNFSYCFKKVINSVNKDKNQVHTRALHAEENAILQLAKYGGVGIRNGILFTTASPCELCAKKVYQLGVKFIFYIDPYPGISERHILDSGTNKPKLVLFTGAIGRAYYHMYEPMMPYKDELEVLLAEEP